MSDHKANYYEDEKNQTKKKVRKGLKRVNIDIPEKLHKAWRIEAFKKDVSFKDFIYDMLMSGAKKQSKKRVKKVKNVEKQEENPPFVEESTQ